MASSDNWSFHTCHTSQTLIKIAVFVTWGTAAGSRYCRHVHIQQTGCPEDTLHRKKEQRYQEINTMSAVERQG